MSYRQLHCEQMQCVLFCCINARQASAKHMLGAPKLACRATNLKRYVLLMDTVINDSLLLAIARGEPSPTVCLSVCLLAFAANS